MREIKFRAWHQKKQVMFSPENMGADQLTIMPDGRGFVNVSGTDVRASVFITDMIPMQFTGLKDKYGREIYEGDWVKSDIHNPTIFKVEFIEGGFCCTYTDSIPIDINHFFPSVGCQIEITGNVYENPVGL